MTKQATATAQQARQPLVDAVLRSAVASVVQYCATEETKRELEAKVVAPVLDHLGARFAWATRLVQALVALALVQTLLLAWLLVRDLRRLR